MSSAEMMNRIEKSVELKASPERVWRALTVPAEFSVWFGVEITGEFSAGERVDMVSTHPSCAGQRFWIDIVEMTPPRRFSYRWKPGAVTAESEADAGTTLVEFTIDPAGTGSKLTVVESGFEAVSIARRATAFSENTQGWIEQMKSIAEYLAREGR